MRQALSQQQEEGWEDAGLHDPWALSSLHSSFNTMRSAQSNSWHNETTMSTRIGGDEAIAPPAGLFRFATTPIDKPIPEGDKISLRDIPFSEEVSAAIQQHRLKLKTHEQGEDEGEDGSTDEEKAMTLPPTTLKQPSGSAKMEISFTEASTEGNDYDLPPSLLETDITTHHDLISAATDENLLTEEYALERLRFLFPDESFGKLPEDFPRFDISEIETGKSLGKGGFSDVYEIRKFRKEDGDNVPASMDALRRSREFIRSKCLNHLGEAEFALKHLREDVKKDPARAWTGMVDLVVEIRILLHMQHPHILKLRGVAQGNLLQPDFFLVLDRLAETVARRLVTWKAKKTEYKTKTPLLLRPFVRKARKEAAAELWKTRLQYAYELTSALQHMHSHRVIHRDIKAENIGFCLKDNIKLFDFGLARQIQSTDEVYHLSMMTGSLRYMAPEVALGHPYNQKCDVYSFSVLLWEMLALKRPYDQYPNAESLIQRVFEEDERPKLSRKWPVGINEAFKAGWDPDQFHRLTMAQLGEALRDELMESLEGEDEAVPMTKNVRQRSSKFYKFSEKTQTVMSLTQDGFSAVLEGGESSEVISPC
jgi:serine/threonine protein kinase